MTSRRNCPKCGVDHPLQQRHVEAHDAQSKDQRPAVDIDVCPQCRGVWLDWGELGRLRDLRDVLDGLQANMHWRDDQRGGDCPVCKKPLARVPVGAFAVDRCPDCSGIWFDGGELGPMLTDQGFTALLNALLDAKKQPGSGR